MGSSEIDLSQCEKLIDHTNFSLWNFDLFILLKSSKLDGIVLGNEKLETTDSEKVKTDWNQRDAKAQKCIVFTIDKRNKLHIINCKSSAEMYDTLKKLFDQDEARVKCSTLEEFFTFQYDSGFDMATNLSKLENIVFKLNSSGQKIETDMHIARIMSILPSHFQPHFMTAWDSTPDDQKTIANLKARLIRDEKRYNPTSSNGSSAAVAFKAHHVKCYTCGGDHYADKCPKKQSNARKKAFNKFPPCKSCGRTNHEEKDCRYKKSFSKNNPQKASYLTYTRPCEQSLCSEKLITDHSENQWVIDSGSTCHMTSSNKILSNKTSVHTIVGTSKKGQYMKAKAVGKVEAAECTLKNVLYLPGLDKNLLSVNAITQNGGKIEFDKNKVTVSQNGNVVLSGQKDKSGLYLIDINPDNKEFCHLSPEKCNSSVDWHRKLGHLGYDNMKKLSQISTGLEFQEIDVDVCQVCQEAKQARRPFKNQRTRATRPLEILHTDLVEVEVCTWDNCKYFITCLDDYTHYTTVYLLNRKSDAVVALKRYIAEAENKWNLKLQKIRSDGGGEYISTNFKSWCAEKGIILDYTIPHTPMLNGSAERLNRSLMEKVRALLFDSKLDHKFWGEALYTAANLLNRSPTRTLKNCTPAEKWFNKKPDLSHFQLFGSKVHYKKLGYVKKLEKRSLEGFFVGYGTNGYRIWDENKNKILISRDVVFGDETPTQLHETYFKSPILSFDRNLTNWPDSDEEGSIQSETDTTVSNEEAENEQNSDPDYIPEQLEELSSSDTSSQSLSPNDEEGIQEQPLDEQVGRGQRRKNLPPRLQDYALFTNPSEFSLLTYQQAISGDDNLKWKEAIQEEMSALEENATWRLVDRSEVDGKILSSRWIFKIKEDGRYKARLVVRGCHQRDGIDYNEIFSPVVGSDALRTIIAYSAMKNLKLMKFDIKTAFLYGNIKENIYMSLPEGFEKKNKVCKLQKALYGLKQAPAMWNKRLTDFLQNHGLTKLKTEQCVFVNNDRSIILAIHIDDGLLVGSNEPKMKEFLQGLKKEFKMTIDENPKTYLGINFSEMDGKLKLSQENYAQQIVEKFRMTDAKPVSTPLIAGNGCGSQEREKGMKFPYREAVGSLLYLSTKTRPDLSFAVSVSGRHVEKPKHSDLNNLKRTIKYVKTTKDLGISYYKKKTAPDEPILEAYCDSDYAGDEETRKSTTGFIIFFNGGPVSWSSRRQPIVATSTTEAEYIAATEAAKALIYLKSFLSELTQLETSATLNIDNQSAIDLVQNGVLNRRSKHIDVRFHFIREKIEENLI